MVTKKVLFTLLKWNTFLFDTTKMKKTCSKIDCAQGENKIHLNNVNSTYIWQLRKTRIKFLKTHFFGGSKGRAFFQRVHKKGKHHHYHGIKMSYWPSCTSKKLHSNFPKPMIVKTLTKTLWGCWSECKICLLSQHNQRDEKLKLKN